MILFFIKIIYFMLPAYFANMAPIFFKKHFNFLAVPIDCGKIFYGASLFGKTKTIRGFVVGILMAVFVVFLQSFVLMKIAFFNEISLIDYSNINFILLGVLFGAGALLGDLAESFVKRRIGKNSSESWKVFDQLDYIMGALLFVSPIIVLKLSEFVGILIVSLVLTIIINQVGWLMNLREERW
ncbi:MAG: CDP-archaeol synthase [Patescibacteria group bacterium]